MRGDYGSITMMRPPPPKCENFLTLPFLFIGLVDKTGLFLSFSFEDISASRMTGRNSSNLEKRHLLRVAMIERENRLLA
jgi:hypothetical protein